MLDRNTPKRVFAQVQLILSEEGGPGADTSKAAVKCWVRQFLEAWLPDWKVGEEYDYNQAVYVGQMFEALYRRHAMAKARREKKQRK